MLSLQWSLPVSVADALPIGKTAQRALERRWASAMRRGVLPDGVRPLVKESWARALRTDVSPSLPKAPLVWDDIALEEARLESEWLPFAQRSVATSTAPYAEGGHILTLFDAAGRMLWSEGDPRALEGLAGINFRPGAMWAEDCVGTNGPGTALATGQPVHIVGAEHFCEQWHAWHCAAMPVRDPLTGEICGVVDISGFRDAAHPHTLTLTSTLVLAIEQMLRAREAERRILVMQRMTDLAGRWPGDTAFAIDRCGALIGALHDTPVGRTRMGAIQQSMRDAVSAARQRDERGRHIEQSVTLGDGSTGILYPVVVDAVPVGACVIVPRPSERRPTQLPPRRHTGASTRYTFADLIGSSAALSETIHLATAAAETELPVLLEGESGTGKELVAQGIHAAGTRGRGPFIAVNCAALPHELIESELFGYLGGAFSGARREGQSGKFEAAHGGTIFLDEVAELPPTAQAALLRVLQEGEITPIGSAHSRRVDVRVIAATNRDLAAAAEQGAFRTDLYYRLNVLGITLPPLRARPDDIEELAEKFLMEAASDLGRPVPRLSEAQVGDLRNRVWPGNVRELKNLMRRVVALGPGVLQRDDHGPRVPTPRTSTAPDAQRDELIAAVRSCRTMAEAAARLGVTRSTLYRRMESLGLKPERYLSDR